MSQQLHLTFCHLSFPKYRKVIYLIPIFTETSCKNIYFFITKALFIFRRSFKLLLALFLDILYILHLQIWGCIINISLLLFTVAKMPLCSENGPCSKYFLLCLPTFVLRRIMLQKRQQNGNIDWQKLIPRAVAERTELQTLTACEDSTWSRYEFWQTNPTDKTRKTVCILFFEIG